jgi:2-polyprenyl-6-methoxyphenol hydroxylase-like FAD-dependent oxidoreductase
MRTTGSKIIVLGAGICGLASGMLLCRDGHDVTILERDSAAVPDSPGQAWEHWARDGVAQFRQPHYLQSQGRIVLEQELPEILAALAAAGGLRFDPLCLMPSLITDRTPRDGDERFKTVTARRPVLEHVLARAAGAEPGLDVRRSVSVRELVTRAHNRTPHVVGVRTDRGDELRADLVVDAMGRRSRLPQWLRAAGTSPVQEQLEDAGFIYYTRYFRSRTGALPQFKAPLFTAVGTFSVLTLPCDDAMWSVTVCISAGDQALKRLRHPDPWTGVVAACPRHAHWLDGKAVTGVLAMGGLADRHRRFNVGGRPVATGIAAVGDACVCTNPTNGRGMSLGLMHVRRLRDVLRGHLEDPREFAEAWDAVTEAELTPWYRDNVEEDRARLDEMNALRHGLEPPAPGTRSAALRRAVFAAAPHDPDVFRAALASLACLTPLREPLANPEFVEDVLRLARERGPSPAAGPNRGELLQLLGGLPLAA